MLTMSDFIVVVYYLVADVFATVLGDQRLRRRGPAPALSDSEVITMEIVGEFLGIDTDKGIWEYFHRHWHAWFPALGSRSQFARQASDLWNVKQRIQQALARALGAPTADLHIVDGHPMPVAGLTRARQSKRFRDVATIGYCASKDQYYYGLHGHLLITEQGLITAYTVTGATVDEREAAWDLLDGVMGKLLGDKGYLSAFFKSVLREHGLHLEAPVRKNMKEIYSSAERHALLTIRRRIETVIGQLTDHFHIEKVWARDLWHLTSRIARKLLAHTIGFFLNRRFGREPLQFEGLIA
jgi:hypothetical protein